MPSVEKKLKTFSGLGCYEFDDKISRTGKSEKYVFVPEEILFSVE
jgi:hypothetical protein